MQKRETGLRNEPAGREGKDTRVEMPGPDMHRRPVRRGHRSVARVTAIVEAVGAQSVPVRLTDVAHATGLDTGTAHRILTALVERGYIHKDRVNRRYSIGFEIFRLGASDPARAITAERAHSFLARLANEIDATVLIGGREGTKVHLYKMIEGHVPPPALTRDFNPYLDAHATAVGKVLLAYSVENEVRALYKENPLRRHTTRTITSIGPLLAELRQIRGQYHALDRGEWRTGVEGFAVPIFNPVGTVNLAIWVVAPPDAPVLRDCERALAQARRSAHDIICYATGKSPLVWAPARSANSRTECEIRERRTPC